MRPIDADALLQRAIPHGWSTPKWVSDIMIDDAPTIDAVPVIRCKDCKWWGLSDHNTLGVHTCKKYSGVRFDSDYCSRAERSEE